MILSDLSSAEIALEHILDRIRGFTVRIHQSVDLSEILNITVQEVREMLESDRALYQAKSNGRNRFFIDVISR